MTLRIDSSRPAAHLRGKVVSASVPVSLRELLHKFDGRPHPADEHGRAFARGKIRFVGIGERDVYNITAPFRFVGRTLIAGRVESRWSEHSTVVFFQRRPDGAWEPCPDAPTFDGLQDPCVTRVGEELVLGGVRFPARMGDGQMSYRMEFLRGRSLDRLETFLVGPDVMKDIRLVQMLDGRVGVFSRPQGELGGRGKIGFTTADSLDRLDARLIESAPLFAGQFVESEWGGANEIHVLRNGHLGVLGHIACFDEREHRHYYGMVFGVDPRTGASTPIRIIARRSDFPPGPAKRADLVDVIFSGGLVRHWDGTATLFAGISDAEAAFLNLPDPFVDLET